MSFRNFEFKAKARNLDACEEKLIGLGPRFCGEDRQIDTYFVVPRGRLKLREGNIENALIYYERGDQAGARQSEILLYEQQPSPALKEILIKLHGIRVIVEKLRRIYFIDQVKFHFDRVRGLGEFLEVEAIDRDGKIGEEQLQKQCRHFAHFFDIAPGDYIANSYSDLLIEKELQFRPL
jgi:predicted adenylyl cyclase CyaB